MNRRQWTGEREAKQRSEEALQELAETRTTLMLPRQAAVELQDMFRRLARALRPGDKSTQDDLVQEMSLGALKCDEPHTRSYFLQLGVSRALNWLRWWDEPSTGPLHDDLEAREAPSDIARERCRDVVRAA